MTNTIIICHVLTPPAKYEKFIVGSQPMRMREYTTMNNNCLLLYNFVKKCSNNAKNEYKYTAIFGQLVICIVGNQFDKLTCAKHKEKTYFDPFHSIPFSFLHKSNMLVNFKMFKTYIEANTCLFSCFFGRQNC